MKNQSNVLRDVVQEVQKYTCQKEEQKAEKLLDVFDDEIFVDEQK